MIWDKAFRYKDIIQEFPDEHLTERVLSYHKTHCTINPDDIIEVSDQEFLDMVRDYAATLIRRAFDGHLIRFTDVKMINTAVTAVTKRADLADTSEQQKAIFKIIEDAAKQIGTK